MKNSSIILRDYIPSDLESLAILTTELGYPTSVSEMEVRLKEISENPNCRTIVAEQDSHVIGYMGLLKSSSWEHNECYVRIQALVVKSEYRKFGVGKSLIAYAESWGREAGARSIVLNCGNREERNSAHKFYHSVGFEAKSTGYKKDVL
jgi:GNAT superfamily N-acetyltransferase